ncbi:unnamed protein product [Amoebophrya sp. A25]|nr:unnamed protein product [Amoebophrya sp. A25]|eukprot:GSA25T00003634001.1
MIENSPGLYRPSIGKGRFNTWVMHARNHTKRVLNALIYHRNVVLSKEYELAPPQLASERQAKDGIANLRFHLVDYDYDFSAEPYTGLRFHHVKVKKSALAFDLLRVPVVLVNEGVETALETMVSTVATNTNNGRKVPFTFKRLLYVVRKYRYLTVVSSKMKQKRESVEKAIGLGVEHSGPSSTTQDEATALQLPISIIGVNLWGNVGTFVNDDTMLAKFYRSIRRHPADEFALYVYTADTDASEGQHSDASSAGRVIERSLPYAVNTDNRVLIRGDSQRPAQTLEAAIIDKFASEKRLWIAPSLYEGCTSNSGLERFPNAAKHTLAPFLQGCSVGWNITDLTVWAYKNPPKIGTGTSGESSPSSLKNVDDVDKVDWLRVNLVSSSHVYAQLVEPGGASRENTQVNLKYGLTWDKEAFSFYVPKGNDYCVGVREKAPQEWARKISSTSSSRGQNNEVEEQNSNNNLLLAAVGSRIQRGPDCTDKEQNYKHVFSFGMIPMPENPIAMLCIGSDDGHRGIRTPRWIVTLAMVGSCVGKPRVLLWQWKYHVLVFKTLPSGWREVGGPVGGVGEQEQVRSSARQSQSPGRVLSVNKAAKNSPTAKRMCVKARKGDDMVDNPSHFISPDCKLTDEEEQAETKVLFHFFVPSQEMTHLAALYCTSFEPSQKRFAFKEADSVVDGCLGMTTLRKVSRTLLSRPFLLVKEDDETCSDSFLCPYRVGASVRYP